MRWRPIEGRVVALDQRDTMRTPRHRSAGPTQSVPRVAAAAAGPCPALEYKCLVTRQLCCLVTRLILVKAREVIKAIKAAGGQQVRQVGSHKRFVVEYTQPDGAPSKVSTTVADHGGDIPTGTLAAIEKQLEPALGKGWLRR